ncbi:uncharacterized protein LOC111873651 isoform X2 [Cryptotermes secundus]|uniref:uncharacterized protein LOC111873651 isoform X2 n=1 Tax=Cryptotermes secundus TaxID=105785 RepID=UPI000CD7D74B|nr:uncharacterized protein LOC111873651 isoform X2 [Cryptotermes secundus]
MSEQITPTSKMATSVVMNVSGYALCRWTLTKALVGILLLLMSVAGSHNPSPQSISGHSSAIDATSVSLELKRKSYLADNVIMSGETIVKHTKTVNQSSDFDKRFTRPELVQSSSLSVIFSENPTVKENIIDTDDAELSTQRLPRSIDSKISTSQILENSAATPNRKVTSLESRNKNGDRLCTNEVDNCIGGKAGEYYRTIQPTKTISVQKDDRAEIVKTTSVDGRFLDEKTHSGEEHGAPRGRSLSLTEPETPTAFVDGTKKTNASQIAEESLKKETETPGLPSASFRSNYDERKTSPDIQDIITGIVKLLNGNVKVQANPNLPPGGMMGGGRPLRPLSTRINNRGPPRITDVPPLPPDFDTSGPHPTFSHHPPALIPLQTSSRLPPPYPFDRPPVIVPLPPQPSENHHQPDHPFMTGVPLPEQVVPVSNSNSGNRPPGNQGTVRPQRPRPPRPRPSLKPNWNNNRRPQPIPQPGVDQLLPFHKPGVNKNTEHEDHKISITVMEDQDNQDNREYQYTTLQAPETLQEGEEFITTTTTSKSQLLPFDIPSSMSEEDLPITTEDTRSEIPNKAEKEQEKHTSYIKSPGLNTSTEEPKIIATLTSSSSTVNEATKEALSVTSESTKAHDTAVLAGSSSEIPILEPSIGVGVATPVLESSMHDIITHDSTALNDWEEPQGPTTSTGTPTSVLPSNLPSLSGETSSGATSSSIPAKDKLKQTTGGFPYYPYRSRTGIVLDDTEYKPMGVMNRPIITAPPPVAGHVGDIFDVTVTAIQGPGGTNTGQPFIYPVEIEGVKLSGSAGSEVSVITKAEEGQHFVSIDGKRTYINLFGSSTEQGDVMPTRIQQGGHTLQPQKSSSTIGTGFAVLETEESASHHGADQPPPSPPRRPYNKRPTHPPVRIDMCTVGDDSTCDSAQNEMCRTELGVSSCHCRPGYSRRKHREPCRRVVSILMSLRVDRLYDRRVVWDGKLQNPESEEYKTLEWESSRAIDSAMLMTPFSDDFMGVRVNGLYTVPEGAQLGGSKWGAVFVNLTLQLEESAETLRPAVRHDIQRHLLGVIHRRNNNVGHSALWVDSPPGSISHLQDVNECTSRELHDCHHEAQCSNVFGSFRCSCPEGYRDPWAGNPHRSGRQCETCSPEHCSGRGECRYEAGQPVCHCSSNFYGSQCEVDGEVLGVAVGASVAAVVIIVLTLVCLCMWSRRWSREQKTAAGMGSPVFGYMATGGSTVKTPAVGSPPYQVSLEDRLRWAQIADVMVQANHYAPEPVPGPTRPSSAMFGYPSLTMSGTLPHGAPPVPLPRLGLTNMSHTGAMSVHGGTAFSTLGALSSHGMRTPDRTVESTSSEEEDRADLLGRNFHVPRPKSRSSVANQSGIYYDVDCEQDAYSGFSKSQQAAIPMSTYTMSSRAPYYRQ